jgi:hypothetical protein
MEAVVAAVAAAVVYSCGSGGGGVGCGGGGMMVTPVTSHPFAAPTAHLEMESRPHYSRGFFHTCMKTTDVLLIFSLIFTIIMET